MQYDWLVYNSASLVISSATTFDGLLSDTQNPIDFETPSTFTYEVTVTPLNQLGANVTCPSSASIIVDFYPSPDVTLVSGTFCNGDLASIDVFTGTHIQTTASINVMDYQWTVYDDGHNPVRTTSGSLISILENSTDIHNPATFEYEVTVTNTNQPTQCAITTSSFITFLASPIAILSASDICAQDVPLIVSAFDASHISSGTNVMQYDWVVLDNENGNAIIASATTLDGLFTDVPRAPIDFETPRPYTYQVTITNTNQVGTICPTTASIVINYFPDPEVTLVSGSFCEGDLTSIDVFTGTHVQTSASINVMSYAWTVYDDLRNPIRTTSGSSIITIEEIGRAV